MRAAATRGKGRDRVHGGGCCYSWGLAEGAGQEVVGGRVGVGVGVDMDVDVDVDADAHGGLQMHGWKRKDAERAWVGYGHGWDCRRVRGAGVSGEQPPRALGRKGVRRRADGIVYGTEVPAIICYIHGCYCIGCC